MGIHGIYKEIGPGERIALAKLAIDKFEATGRPFRIAIDVSIWLFQIQASKGGTNPALRTFYYRLLRIIALSIHPIFVFDGPNKPPFKRNRRTGPTVASIPEFLAKQLLKQFGFPIHLAPGEAEAECALLQREGIVDAVLSEDVDTMMFGSGITIRNWSPEQKSAKTPTHVNVYDAVKTKNGPSGLDREGMILIALMSGGDYVPEGIPGCGPKIACEAARAGFGSDLCKIAKGDSKAMQEWRERLQHELKTNESKLFKRKHGTLVIPDTFPRADILGYYTHPAISNQTGLDKLRRSIKWDQELDFVGLREFTLDAFGWAKLSDAKHFIRSLAPSLLVRRLRLRGESVEKLPTQDLTAIQEDESLLVKGLHGKRQHGITDNSTELRVSFMPIDLVKIDLEAEEPDIDVEVTERGLDDENDDELEAALEVDDEGDEEGAHKKRAPTKFDPCKPMRVWVLETIVKVGVPLKVQDWEASLQKPKRAATAREASKAAPKPRATRQTKASGEITQRPINAYTKVTKPGVKKSRVTDKLKSVSSNPPATFQPTAPPRNDVISLLSSSPVKPLSTVPPRPVKEKSLSPLLEELPPSITKRKKRAAMQRSHTMPADTSTLLDRPTTPSCLEPLEMLDLVSSPALPSPAQLPAKKARTRVTRNPPVTRTARQASVSSSPGKYTQTTLDTWSRGSPAVTPTKPRKTTPPLNSASILPPPSPPRLQASRREVETLDLTLSSPPRSPPATQPIIPSRTTAVASPPRPPLQSKSSNATQSTSSSLRSNSHRASLSSPSCTSDLKTTSKSSVIAEPRRTSPRLQKSNTAEFESLDLTTLSSPSSNLRVFAKSRRSSPRLRKTTSAEIESLDLTQLSSPISNPVHAPMPETSSFSIPPPRRPSPPVQHSPPPPPTSTSSILRRTSPPAAWKTREKKKREIVLRESLNGSWDFAEVGSSPAGSSAGIERKGGSGGLALKGKARRRWRESEIEVLDLS
ncbi:hypothetical protein K505DRAFT_370111 [Melanomma pulvis-pyrius CBS 109.77]|uniref:Flap structure-specific endonuclease n=1 Tax=Melanomma pulvis-pyrius CBS 109.77 TaxID=1314802 RepID=A0A6A6XVT0_9PLEO|nr:hypothetical protein K505DRAFT_370111 [Melanomma pulvis-pyrius CBS 109.77]